MYMKTWRQKDRETERHGDIKQREEQRAMNNQPDGGVTKRQKHSPEIAPVIIPDGRRERHGLTSRNNALLTTQLRSAT